MKNTNSHTRNHQGHKKCSYCVHAVENSTSLNRNAEVWPEMQTGQTERMNQSGSDSFQRDSESWNGSDDEINRAINRVEI